MSTESITELATVEQPDLVESAGGVININDEVIAFIATMEMVKVDGVLTLSGRSSFSDYDGARSKDVEKGVTVTKKDNHCSIALEINLKYGVNVYDTAHHLQRAVRNAIENYLGMLVDKVDITIRGMINEPTLPVVKKA